MANGGVATIEAQARANDPFPLRMTPQLYRNLGNGRFEDVSSRAGAVFKLADVGRGAAFGDIDNDGDTDVVVGNANGRCGCSSTTSAEPEPLARAAARRRRRAPRDMLGARVSRSSRTGQPTLWRRARADGSYASANDPRVLVGLGASAEAPRVQVTWPSGRVEEFAGVPIDRYVTLEEGSDRK